MLKNQFEKSIEVLCRHDRVWSLLAVGAFAALALSLVAGAARILAVNKSRQNLVADERWAQEQRRVRENGEGHAREQLAHAKGAGARVGSIAEKANPEVDEAIPSCSKPLLFNTEEADRIVESLQVFPPDNPWKEDVSQWPVSPDSQAMIASIGLDKPLRYNPDMGFVLVPPNQKMVDVKIGAYADESDGGPFPVPESIPIEGWPIEYPGKKLEEVQRVDDPKADRHGIVVDPSRGMLYEFARMVRTDTGWVASQASVFDLRRNSPRPEGWTSTDAAGMPLFPAIIRYDELKRGIVSHAMRVTVRKTRKEFVYPARHYASRSQDPRLPRMGERLRLRQDYDISTFSPQVQAILKGLKKHGMFVADNGIEWAISVTPDLRIGNLHEELRKVKGSAFEVVQKKR